MRFPKIDNKSASDDIARSLTLAKYPTLALGNESSVNYKKAMPRLLCEFDLSHSWYLGRSGRRKTPLRTHLCPVEWQGVEDLLDINVQNSGLSSSSCPKPGGSMFRGDGLISGCVIRLGHVALEQTPSERCTSKESCTLFTEEVMRKNGL